LFDELVTNVMTRVGDFTSPNGNDCSFWLVRTSWDVYQSIAALENEGLLLLEKIVEDLGFILAQDQRRELYSMLLNTVTVAAAARWERDPETKKIHHDPLATRLSEAATRVRSPGRAYASSPLAEKMVSAGLPGDVIEAAQEQHRRYRLEVLTSRYAPFRDRERIESEIEARLFRLKNDLDAGLLKDNGLQFHSRCLTELDLIRSEMPEGAALPRLLIYGMMYDVTNRCLHRFTPLSLAG
jgi:hypothetical protein